MRVFTASAVTKHGPMAPGDVASQHQALALLERAVPHEVSRGRVLPDERIKAMVRRITSGPDDERAPRAVHRHRRGLRRSGPRDPPPPGPDEAPVQREPSEPGVTRPSSERDPEAVHECAHRERTAAHRQIGSELLVEVRSCGCRRATTRPRRADPASAGTARDRRPHRRPPVPRRPSLPRTIPPSAPTAMLSALSLNAPSPVASKGLFHRHEPPRPKASTHPSRMRRSPQQPWKEPDISTWRRVTARPVGKSAVRPCCHPFWSRAHRRAPFAPYFRRNQAPPS